MFLLPYPGELFYSTLARTADALGLTNARDVARLLFGLPRLTPTIEVPPRLDQFIPRLLPGNPLNAEILLRDHSLFNYYGAFSSPTQRASAKEAATNGDAKTALSLLNVAGVRPPSGLRYCLSCATDDRAASNTPFWRRSHQAPAVLVCPTHLEPLLETESLRASERLGFVSLESALANRINTLTPKIEAGFPLLAAIAQSSETLSSYDPDGEDLLDRFYAYLHAQGWQHGKRLAARSIMEAVRDAFGPDILANLGVGHAKYASLADPNKRGSSTDWLHGLLRVRGHLRHPLAIILVTIALKGTVKDLLAFTPPASASMIEHRSGPCGNPLCPEYDPPTPRPLPCARADIRLQIACPTCGFTYTQAPNTERRKERRIIAFGELWDLELKKVIDSGEGTKLGLEARFGCDIYTIKRRAATLDLWHPRWGEETKRFSERRNARTWSATREKLRAKYRRRWLSLAAKAPPGTGRREIGRADEVAYQFLRTYDAAWLDANTPQIRRGSQPKEDLSDQDQELARLIDDAAAKLRAESPCTAITIEGIARALGSPHILQPRRRAMPTTSAALAAACDTNESLVKRIADHICRTICNDGIRRSSAQIQLEFNLSPTRWAQVLPLVRETLAHTNTHALIDDDQ